MIKRGKSPDGLGHPTMDEIMAVFRPGERLTNAVLSARIGCHRAGWTYIYNRNELVKAGRLVESRGSHNAKLYRLPGDR